MGAKIKDILYNIVYQSRYALRRGIRYVRALLTETVPPDPKKIPVIINNFNQLDYLLMLIDSLTERGYDNIHILDNASTYPPLLKYYESCPHTVYRMKNNYGYLALWESGLYKKFYKDFYVYTDPDVVPLKECPDDFMQTFVDCLRRHKTSAKVGFSLAIDDLPDCNPKKQEIIDWENQYWKKLKEPGLYDAPIDTTFALYRPYTKDTRAPEDHIFRFGPPYTLRHLPWYQDPNNLTENMIYYKRACESPTHWTSQL